MRGPKLCNPVGGLTTRGRCLIAGGFAAGVSAVVLDERDLLRVAVAVLALPVLSALALNLSPLRLRVGRTVSPPAVSVGAPAEVRLELATESRLPLPGLLLSDGVPALLGTQPHYAVGALRPGTSVTVTYPLVPRLRGRHELGPIHLRLADPLGLVEVHRALPGTTPVLVRPQVLDLTTGLNTHPPSDAGGTSAEAAWSAAYRAPDAVVRPYQDGEDLRTVHWRSSARRGELMVRPAEQGRRSATVVVLDNRVDAHRGIGANSSLERAVSLAASVAARLHAVGVPLRLVTADGADLGAGPAALDHLAVLSPRAGISLGGALDLADHEEIVAILGELDERDGLDLIAAGGGRPGRAVVLGGVGAGAPTLGGAGWVVRVVPDSTSLSESWEQLSTAHAVGGSW